MSGESTLILRRSEFDRVQLLELNHGNAEMHHRASVRRECVAYRTVCGSEWNADFSVYISGKHGHRNGIGGLKIDSESDIWVNLMRGCRPSARIPVVPSGRADRKAAVRFRPIAKSPHYITKTKEHFLGLKRHTNFSL